MAGISRYLAALLLVSCSGAAPPPETPPRAVPRAPAAPVDKAPEPMSEEGLRRDIDWLCDPAREGRGSYQPGGARTADWIAERFAAMGLEVVRRPIVPGGIDSVFGIKRGGEQAVIVSAHYDHLGKIDGVVYLGADDNASGVAVLLAIAGAAKERAFSRTVIFAAFGAEERGLIGSGLYVQDPVWPLDATHAIINFDMVGRQFFEAGAAKVDTAAVVGLEGDAGARDVALRAAKRVGLALVVAPASLLELFGYDNRTDEWRFRRAGVKSIHFSTGMHVDYHKPSDTPDKLVYSQMLRIAQTASDLLSYLAGLK